MIIKKTKGEKPPVLFIYPPIFDVSLKISESQYWRQ